MDLDTHHHHDADDPRARLRPDCSRCAALCCTLLGFARSADFPVDKPAGTPCPELGAHFDCTIHDRLRPRGFRGCTVFECAGAGQRVTQDLFAGVTWRDRPDLRPRMSAAFAVVRQVHEALWYLAEVRERTYDPDVEDRAAVLVVALDAALDAPVEEVVDVDLPALLAPVRDLLHEVGDEVRTRFRADERTAPTGCEGDDHSGRDLRAADLAGALFRNASLIGADLRGADLTGAELLGADLRDARLEGSDLSGALFLTQAQVNAARGDAATLLPRVVRRPAHWAAG